LGKNSAKTNDSKQTFVGQPRNVCLVAYAKAAPPGGFLAWKNTAGALLQSTARPALDIDSNPP
jgi:hypothetical protein